MRFLTGRHLTARELSAEREFGMPFAEILRGYATDPLGPCSVAFTAKSLGIPCAELRARLPLHDPHGEIPWPPRNQRKDIA